MHIYIYVKTTFSVVQLCLRAYSYRFELNYTENNRIFNMFWNENWLFHFEFIQSFDCKLKSMQISLNFDIDTFIKLNAHLYVYITPACVLVIFANLDNSRLNIYFCWLCLHSETELKSGLNKCICLHICFFSLFSGWFALKHLW